MHVTQTAPKITPCLWFDGNAEEAVRFWTSVFPDSDVGRVSRYGDAGPGPKGTVMVMEFTLAGQSFMALNGGPQFQFTPAVSFHVACETQEEIDRLWERLSEGGEKQPCGWLQDRFGVSWQIDAEVLADMLADEDEARAQRVMEAMLKMTKIDIGALDEAYRG